MPDPIASPHVPVLLDEMLTALDPRDGEIFVDATFGAGGYTSAILSAARCRVIAFDRDPDARGYAEALAARHPDRFELIGDAYSTMSAHLASRKLGPASIDGVVMDIGVSSMQIDQGERGFSFSNYGPLDMRMSQSGRSAADVLAEASEEEIADILYHLGEERRSRRIARAIVTARQTRPLTRTGELAQLVVKALQTPKIDGRHAATRTFQALRIHVNDELGELERGLAAAERLLKPGGRLVVVTFHSLEDGLVKRFLQGRTGRTPRGSRHAPVATGAETPPSFRFVNHRPVSPSEAELARNPRSRSARLRQAVRTDAPAWDAAVDERG